MPRVRAEQSDGKRPTSSAGEGKEDPKSRTKPLVSRSQSARPAKRKPSEEVEVGSREVGRRNEGAGNKTEPAQLGNLGGETTSDGQQKRIPAPATEEETQARP